MWKNKKNIQQSNDINRNCTLQSYRKQLMVHKTVYRYRPCFEATQKLACFYKHEYNDSRKHAVTE